MRDLPTHLKFRSEKLESTFAHLIGTWYVQCKYMKDTYGAKSAAYVDAMQNWWWGMESLRRLMIACPDAVHAQVALSNHMHDIKKMIEQELGIEFSFTDKNLNFRHLVKYPLEFPEFQKVK